MKSLCNAIRPRLALALAAVLLLGACAVFERDRPDTQDQLKPSGPDAVSAEEREEPIVFDADELEPEEGDFTGTETFPGTGVFIDEAAAARRPPPAPDDGEVTLNFEGQGIQEVIHAILGHMLQENYTIAPGVGGEVTFSTARPITRDQILPILEMLLRWNGATLIWRENRYHVLPVSEAVRGNLVPRRSGVDAVRGYEVLAVPLRYISPSKMVEVLEPYAREDGILAADNARSLLFLAGTRAELRNYIQIIETFDVDWLSGMSVGIFELRRVEVGEVIMELEGVFGDGGETPLAGMFRFMPLERLNSIMVITPNDHYLEEAEKWIKRLDRSSPEAGSRLFVYRVKNLDADVLAGYLADLFGTGRTPARRDTRRERGELAPGLERAEVTTVGEFQREQARPREQPERPPTREGTIALGDGEDVRITAVLETNSLLIQASPSQYDAILSAIERLDEEPLQVLIEAQILIVSLTDQLRYGVNWFLANRGPEFGGPEVPEGFSTSRTMDRARLGGDDGFFTTVTRRAVDRTFVTATIDALESVSDVRTISSPSLMVRNNSEARINVGQQIPIESRTISGIGVGDTQFGTTRFLSTGTILEVTPRVNPGGLVYLNVRQEVSSAGTRLRPEDTNPPIDTREVSTEVAVQSGQTIILGGLISDEDEQIRSGVPFIQRIPGLGALFRSTSERNNRSETLVLITPTVMESTVDLERVSKEFEKKFRGLEPLRGPGPRLRRNEDQ